MTRKSRTQTGMIGVAERARAISEAEDAGLRGTERQKFILKRTKIHYEELEKLLGDG